MAIKDWEKTSEHKESAGRSWSETHRKGDIELRAWRPASPAHKGFRIEATKDRVGVILPKESFATKAQAKNAATNYMRTH